MKTQEEVVRGHAVGPISIYQIYQEGYQDRELDDRSSFRREAAKDILCAVLAGGIANGAEGFDAQKEELVNASIDMADTLIAKLKEK